MKFLKESIHNSNDLFFSFLISAISGPPSFDEEYTIFFDTNPAACHYVLLILK